MIAKNFSTNTKLLFKIDIFNGKDIQEYSVISSEREILLHPNMNFIVTKEAYQIGNGYNMIELLQLANFEKYIS